jgi:uncharacterized protein (TIGR02300 family)
MAKAELGVKRRCLGCGAPFFDLNRDPIVCPLCSAVFQVIELPHSAPRRAPYRPLVRGAPLDEERSPNIDAEADPADAEIDAGVLENDDSVVQPIEDDDDKIEKIDDLI